MKRWLRDLDTPATAYLSRLGILDVDNATAPIGAVAPPAALAWLWGDTSFANMTLVLTPVQQCQPRDGGSTLAAGTALHGAAGGCLLGAARSVW